ncbi:MAG: YkvA family protein [Halioglobus sp.]
MKKTEDNAFSAAYSDERLRGKLARYARAAGREVVEKVLLLYYAAQEEKAPAWAKATIAGALGYFIVPLDAVTDLAPGIGYVDDLGVLALAIASVAAYINDNVRSRTAARMRDWFGDVTDTPQDPPGNTPASRDTTG